MSVLLFPLFLSIACKTLFQGCSTYGNLRLIFNKLFRAFQNVSCLTFLSALQLEDFKVAQKEQERQIEKEISNRERDINCLKHFRSRCADIVSENFNFVTKIDEFLSKESEYLEKMASQKLKSDSTIKELETEITALTEQLIQSHQQNTDYDDLMKQTAVFQNSMQDLETQNDILRKTIESYESRFSELQVQLEKIHFEVCF